jgi:hypothetical protein
MVDMVELIDKDRDRRDMVKGIDRVINDIVDIFLHKRWLIFE